MRRISKGSRSTGLQNPATGGRSLQPPRNQNQSSAGAVASKRQRVGKLNARRTAALSAEFDRFLEEVFDAVSACMTARRWQDVSPVLETYAAAHVGLTAARLFHGAIAHRLVRHALSLVDRDRFLESVSMLRSEILRAQEPPALADTIEHYRTALKQRDALDAFAAVTSSRSSREVH